MKKRFFAFVLALFVLIPAIVACSDSDDKTDKTTAENPDITTTVDGGGTTIPAGRGDGDSGVTDTERQALIDKAQYSGSDYIVLSYDTQKAHKWSGIPNDIDVEKAEGEWLNEAVWARNDQLFKLTGVTIVYENPGDNNVANTLRADKEGNMQRYSLVNQPLSISNTNFTNGYVKDMNSLDINFNYSWWDQNSIETLKIGDRLIAACSDVTYMDKLSTVAVFFNKSLVSQYTDIPDLYTLTQEGSWTFTKMVKYADMVWQDNDVVGTYDINDVYGISCQNDGGYYFMNAAGITTLTKDANGDPEFTVNNDRGVSALQKIFSMMSNKQLYFNRQAAGLTDENGLAVVCEAFAQDRVLFLARPLQTLYNLVEVTDEYGVIPMPKYFSNQPTYCSPVNYYSSTALCVPANVKDAERSVNVLQVWSMLSTEYVMPKLYHTVLGAKLLSDPVASEMLDIIFDNRIYDIGLIWNIGELRAVLVAGESSYAAYPTGIKRILDQKIDLVERDINNILG